MSLTRRGLLGCTVGMVAVAGCTGGDRNITVYSDRDGPVGVNIRIINRTNEETLADERVTIRENDYDIDYQVSGGKTYSIIISTDDGTTGTYRWDVPESSLVAIGGLTATSYSLIATITQSDIEFDVLHAP